MAALIFKTIYRGSDANWQLALKKLQMEIMAYNSLCKVTHPKAFLSYNTGLFKKTINLSAIVIMNDLMTLHHCINTYFPFKTAGTYSFCQFKELCSCTDESILRCFWKLKMY